ncbi:MAG: hypothetical protein SRB1_02174 [Desulfobacteraceae bacterium Eth-SRB1]|nr:MAG: hypothetical protein SRB1_02174 [Desulfobacteraceae bacterium Eth-SRB1]
MDKKGIMIPVERIEQAILLMRGQKVMLDADLAVLYEVPTKALNQAVKRNERRFPPDFMFRLTKKEKGELVTNCDRFERLKHSSALPRALEQKYDEQFKVVFDAIRALMTPPAKPRKKIGFVVKEKRATYGSLSPKRKRKT